MNTPIQTEEQFLHHRIRLLQQAYQHDIEPYVRRLIQINSLKTVIKQIPDIDWTKVHSIADLRKQEEKS